MASKKATQFRAGFSVSIWIELPVKGSTIEEAVAEAKNIKYATIVRAAATDPNSMIDWTRTFVSITKEGIPGF